MVKVDPLPDWKAEAWRDLGLGRAIRVALEFERHFWPKDVEFLSSRVGQPLASFWGILIPVKMSKANLVIPPGYWTAQVLYGFYSELHQELSGGHRLVFD